MSKIDIDKFIIDLMEQRQFCSDNENIYMLNALKKQNLTIENNEIVEIYKSIIPKFKIGDVIIHNETDFVFYIKEIKGDYYSNGIVMVPISEEDKWDILGVNKVKELLKEQKDIDPDIQEVINNNFWDMLDMDKPNMKIEKGHWYKCIKPKYMSEDFEEGKIYYASEDNFIDLNEQLSCCTNNVDMSPWFVEVDEPKINS